MKEREEPIEDKALEISEWQLCPKCNGTGFIYSPNTMSTGASNTCDVCNGAKILVKPQVEANQSDAVKFGIWLNCKDYQSTPHPDKMRSVHRDEGKPVKISELYKEFKKEP